MFETENDITITVAPKNPESRWVTVNENGEIISEGKTPQEAMELAKKISDNFSIIFAPKEGSTYIF